MGSRRRGREWGQGLAAVAVGIAGERALDTVPGIAGRVLGLVPGLGGGTLRLVPATLEVVLGLVPSLVVVTLAGLPAVPVRGLVVLVGAIALGVGPSPVILTPIGVLDRRV